MSLSPQRITFRKVDRCSTDKSLFLWLQSEALIDQLQTVSNADHLPRRGRRKKPPNLITDLTDPNPELKIPWSGRKGFRTGVPGWG